MLSLKPFSRSWVRSSQFLGNALIPRHLLLRDIRLGEGRGSAKQLPDQISKQSKHKDLLEKLLFKESFETLSLKEKAGKLFTDSKPAHNCLVFLLEGFPIKSRLLKAADSSKTPFTNGYNSFYLGKKKKSNPGCPGCVGG